MKSNLNKKIHNFTSFSIKEMNNSLKEPGYLSVEENESLKLIYKSLRDILLDFKKQISIYHHKNPGKLSISSFIKNNYKLPKDVKLSISSNSTLTIDFDNINSSIRKTFPYIQKDFEIEFVAGSEGASIGHKTQPIRVHKLSIGTTKLFNYPEEALKSSLQHEVQHIANIKKEESNSTTDYSEGGVNYLTDPKEVDSHAKQFAYMYWKKYPDDKLVDIKKLQGINFVKRSKDKLNLYLWFMIPDKFRDQNKSMSDELYKRVKKAGEQFPLKLKYYFQIYQNK